MAARIRPSRRRPRPAFAALGPLLALVLGLAGCGGGGAPDPAEDPTLLAWQARWRARTVDPGRVPELEEGHQAAADGRGLVALSCAMDRLALDPADPEAQLALVAWSARWPDLPGLPPEARARVLAAAAARAPTAPSLQGARAWERLGAGDLAGAEAALAEAPMEERLAATARLRFAQQAGRDPSAAAAALHAADPRDVEGCDAAARAALAHGDLWGAEQVVLACHEAGVHHPPLGRLLGDVLDLAGEPAEACAAYLEGQAPLHAAAIVIQGDRCGLPMPPEVLEVALGTPIPEAALHATWRAVLVGDPARAAPQAEALAALPTADGPPFRAARAAALLLADRPDEALVALGELSGAAAQVLRARALLALGRAAEVPAALDAAVAQEPWNLPLHRERLALLAQAAPPALGPAVAALAEADPVAFALVALQPDRLLPWAALAPDPWPLEALAPEDRRLVAALDPALPAPDLAPARPAVLRAILARRLLAGEVLDGAALGPTLEALVAVGDPVSLALAGAALGELCRGDEATALLDRAEAAGPPGVALLWARANRALDGGDEARARSAADALVTSATWLPGVRGFRYAVELQIEQPSPPPCAGGPRGPQGGQVIDRKRLLTP